MPAISIPVLPARPMAICCCLTSTMWEDSPGLQDLLLPPVDKRGGIPVVRLRRRMLDLLKLARLSVIDNQLCVLLTKHVTLSPTHTYDAAVDR